jgi:hypothetical protein
VFWVISVYFNIRNTLPKSGTFLLGHPVYTKRKPGAVYKAPHKCMHMLINAHLQSVSIDMNDVNGNLN